MSISANCLKQFRNIYTASRYAFIAREQIRKGRADDAYTSLTNMQYNIDKMKGLPEYEKAQ